jgi:hypothetical protein
MINELKKSTAKAYRLDYFSGFFLFVVISDCVFPLDAKLQPSVFKDKQEFQEVKTRREATQLKRTVSFTLRPLYS